MRSHDLTAAAWTERLFAFFVLFVWFLVEIRFCANAQDRAQRRDGRDRGFHKGSGRWPVSGLISRLWLWRLG